jgi:ribosomal protein S18 acetylase RimI-like enzyme
MTATVRIGSTRDIEAVLLLWTGSGAEPTHTDDAPSLQALIEHDGSALLVAEDQGELVGSVLAGWDGWRGSVYRLVVAPTHRRLGVGRRLLAEAEGHLHSVGGRRLCAIVVETEPAATGFWRAGGWEEQRHRLRFVKG